MKQSISFTLMLLSILVLMGNCKSDITEEYRVSKTLTETYKPSFPLSQQADVEVDIPASVFSQLFDKLEEGAIAERIDLPFVSYTIQKDPGNTAATARVSMLINEKPIFNNLILDLNRSGEVFVSSQLVAEGVEYLKENVLRALDGSNQSDIRFRVITTAPDGGQVHATAAFGIRLALTYSNCEELPTGMGDRVCVD